MPTAIAQVSPPAPSRVPPPALHPSSPHPMRRVLLVLTQSLDPLNDIVTQVEQTLPDTQVEIADLTVAAPDYGALLAAVFQADSVQVW